jgi:hypothetical protein
MSTSITHPPDTARLEAALPRLGFVDRVAVRFALRAIVRLEATTARAFAAHDIARELEQVKARNLEQQSVLRRLF